MKSTASGTSAVSPLWAGLAARLVQALGTRIGYLNPLLYRLQRDERRLVNDVTRGGNGDYQAANGWDACTGWGTPIGTRLLHALRPDRTA